MCSQRLLGVARMKSLEKIQKKEREAEDLRRGTDSLKVSTTQPQNKQNNQCIGQELLP